MTSPVAWGCLAKAAISSSKGPVWAIQPCAEWPPRRESSACFILKNSHEILQKISSAEHLSRRVGCWIKKCLPPAIHIFSWVFIYLPIFITELKGILKKKKPFYLSSYLEGKNIFKFGVNQLLWWRRKWQPTLVLLPGESQGQGSLVACRLWGHTESDTTEVT